MPLGSAPGGTYLYSNVGYFLLAMVIEKAADQEYTSYVHAALLEPLAMDNWTLSPTLQDSVSSNEIAAGHSLTGPSVFDLLPSSPLRPFNFEGGNIIWALGKGPVDMVANAENVSKFIHAWNVYGVGHRAYDYGRAGCVPGVATWAESLDEDIDYAVLFNSQPCLTFSSSVIKQIEIMLGNPTTLHVSSHP